MNRDRARRGVKFVLVGLTCVAGGARAAAQTRADVPPPANAAAGRQNPVLTQFEDVIAGALSNTLAHEPTLGRDALAKKAADLCVQLVGLRDPSASLSDADWAFADRVAGSVFLSREASEAPHPGPPPPPAPSTPRPRPDAPLLTGETRDFVLSDLKAQDAVNVRKVRETYGLELTPAQRARYLKSYAGTPPKGAGGETFLDKLNARSQTSLQSLDQLTPDDRASLDALIQEVAGASPDDGGGVVPTPVPLPPAPNPNPDPAPNPAPAPPPVVPPPPPPAPAPDGGVDVVVDGETYEVVEYVVVRKKPCRLHQKLGTRRARYRVVEP